MADSWTQIANRDRIDRVSEVSDVFADEDVCPPATLDIELNLENRKNAIDSAMYGPLNPAEPNNEYWEELADEWNVDADTARQQTCGNCAMFNINSQMKDCISEGVGADRFDLVDAAGELGYCEAFDFKCASARTCRAWVGGGPITDDQPNNEAATKMQGEDPCWDGYVMVGMKKVGNREVPNCVPEDSSVAKTYFSSKSLLSGEKTQIYFGDEAEEELSKRVKSHNEAFAASGKEVTLPMLKAVYRRGAITASSSTRSRHHWGLDRVDAFLKLVRSGLPMNSLYTYDNDLLPVDHPLRREVETSITAAGVKVDNRYNFPDYVKSQTLTNVKTRASEYDSLTEAVLSITEASGLGYDAEINFRAVWLRAVDENDDPYRRTKSFGLYKDFSVDNDLLPVRGEEV